MAKRTEPLPDGLVCLYCGSSRICRKNHYSVFLRYICRSCGKTFTDKTRQISKEGRYFVIFYEPQDAGMIEKAKAIHHYVSWHRIRKTHQFSVGVSEDIASDVTLAWALSAFQSGIIEVELFCRAANGSELVEHFTPANAYQLAKNRGITPENWQTGA